MRLLVPPPQRTAYFSSGRSPGVVLRVSRTRAFVPSIASTQARVCVAMPLARPAMVSALRSAASRARTGPRMLSRTSPRRTRSPSAVPAVSVAPGASRRNNRAASGRPGGAPAPPRPRRPEVGGAVLRRWDGRGAGDVVGDGEVGGGGQRRAAGEVLGERAL